MPSIVSFESGGAQTAPDTGTGTWTAPSVGQLEIVMIRTMGSSTITLPSGEGWNTAVNSAPDRREAAFWRIFTSGMTEAPFTFSSSTTTNVWAHMAVTGFDPTTPVAAATNQASATSTSSVINGTLTPTTAGSLRIDAYHQNSATATITPPAGQASAGTGVGGVYAGRYASETLAGVTATGTRTATSSASAASGGSSLIINPAPAGGGGGAADLRANALGNNAQSATSTSCAFTIPATAQVGDVAIVELSSALTSATTVTTPSGWTLMSGGNMGTTGQQSWQYGKVLVSGEPGATATFSLPSSQRFIGHMAVYSGVTLTGYTVALDTDTTSGTTTALTIPSTAGSVAAGSVVHVSFARRMLNAAPANVTIPAGYSQGANERTATSYAASGTELSIESMYEVIASAGIQGGETATGSVASAGHIYITTLPSAVSPGAPLTVTGSGSVVFGGTPAVAGALAVTGSGALALSGRPTATGALTVTGSGALALGGGPQVARPLTVAGSGALTLSGKPGGTGSLTVTGSGSLSLFGIGTGSLDGTGSGTLTLGTSTIGARGSLTVTGSGTLTLLGQLATAAGTLARTGSGQLTLGSTPRMIGALTVTGSGVLSMLGIKLVAWSVWTGTDWAEITPLVWDGTSWRGDVPIRARAG